MVTLQASGIKQGVFFIMGNTPICEDVDLRSKGFLDSVLELHLLYPARTLRA